MTTTTGHELTVNGRWLEIDGDLDTMDSIPDEELQAACDEAGVRLTGVVIDETTLEVEPVEPATLVAEELSGGIAVRDVEGGGIWWPGYDASAEIEASDRPLGTAVRICREQPMRGTWRQ